MTMHKFHIPVMGIGYTIDTPMKVAKYGISSVISLIDDILIEKMREFYCKKMNLPFEKIEKNDEDSRAKRITAYLNLLDKAVKDKFNEMKNSQFEKGSEIIKYLEMLPEDSKLKQAYNQMLLAKDSEFVQKTQAWIKDNMQLGSIDVNIMTKVDKPNFKGKEKLPSEYNDGHAALRGYALSNLTSSIVLSAGLNPRLYGYMAKFDDFFPDAKGFIKKKIILKVSDYRSAIIQGKFLAKKGLWVSEYRIESGLNCGGHAFATQGHLLGPILEEFKKNRDNLVATMHKIFTNALKKINKTFFENPLDVKFSVQGGIGTAEEHNFLLQHYNVNSIGWGTSFLLVPEVVNVDENTLKLLSNAKKDDLYLSNISPLGIPFNSLRGNTKDEEKQQFIESGVPGSPCPKQYVGVNNEFTERFICTASRHYQRLKIEDLKKKFKTQSEEYKAAFKKVVEKSCICVGLGTPALLMNGLDTKDEGNGVSVCPGPNMAYFSKIISLKEMVSHIYGGGNILTDDERPNLFIKELDIYIEHLKSKIDESLTPLKESQTEYFKTFQKNLQEGISYYKNLFASLAEDSKSMKENFMAEIENIEQKLAGIKLS